MKPVPPLQAAIIRNLKPPSPLLAEEAMRIAIVHWRGCHRFQSIQRIGAQRCHQFHSTNVGLVILAQVVPATLHLGPHARQNSPSATPPTTFPRNNSPSTAPPAAYPRKNSPNAPENSVFRPFWACRANFFALSLRHGAAGRTFSRTGHSDMVALKPMTPLQPLMQANVKPPSPLRAPQQQPLKPTTPMQPKNARNTPISHPQRRRRFQLKLDLREQRRQQFQTTTHLARGLQLRHQRHPCARLSENSHAIRLGEVSIKSENVAIPTL